MISMLCEREADSRGGPARVAVEHRDHPHRIRRRLWNDDKHAQNECDGAMTMKASALVQGTEKRQAERDHDDCEREIRKAGP